MKKNKQALMVHVYSVLSGRPRDKHSLRAYLVWVLVKAEFESNLFKLSILAQMSSKQARFNWVRVQTQL